MTDVLKPSNSTELVATAAADAPLASLNPELHRIYGLMRTKLTPRQRLVCEGVAEGGKSLSHILKETGVLPHQFDGWLAKDDVFRQCYDDLVTVTALEHQTPIAVKRGALRQVMEQGLAIGSPSALREVIRAVELLDKLDHPQETYAYGFGFGAGGTSMKTARHMHRAMNGAVPAVQINIGSGLRDEPKPIN